jgi:hypothetical protein
MGFLASFVVGFAGGWLVRSSFDSSRTAAVRGVSAMMSAVDRVKRAVAMEREHIEDLVAEARAHYEMKRRSSIADDFAPSNEAVRDSRAA